MENQKTKIISIVALVALALTVITATYAYFQAQTGEGSQTDIKINANTVDTFTFATGNPISFTLDQNNFASGKGSVTGSTFASAILTANNKTNTATEHYYVYLNIENNTFTYSINESTPEIIMTVTNSSGTEITDISGLTHTSVTDGKGTTISGYDITNKNGLITLFNNREIVATPTKEEKWNIKVTFVNYNANQNANTGNSMSAKVIIQKEVIPRVVSDVCSNGENLATCITTLANKSASSLTKIYHHDANLTNGAGDNSYRYAGASEAVNNFVCFGSNGSTCPTDNLYRIIGVFGNNVKLIKYDYASSNLLGTDGDYSPGTYSKSEYSTYKGELTTINIYFWNKATESNTWSESNLNKVNLNTNFINNIRSEWAAKIAETTWNVSGHTTSVVTPKVMYTAEITNASKTYGPSDGVSKIGLMYASDYGFAADQSAWTSNLINYNGAAIKSVNWMYMGFYDWTISRHAEYSFMAFYVNRYGNENNSNVFSDNYGVRPSFSLLPSITYKSGSGTQSDPIRIN